MFDAIKKKKLLICVPVKRLKHTKGENACKHFYCLHACFAKNISGFIWFLCVCVCVCVCVQTIFYQIEVKCSSV